MGKQRKELAPAHVGGLSAVDPRGSRERSTTARDAPQVRHAVFKPGGGIKRRATASLCMRGAVSVDKAAELPPRRSPME